MEAWVQAVGTPATPSAGLSAIDAREGTATPLATSSVVLGLAGLLLPALPTADVEVGVP